jgi:hypothetical protein
VTGHPLIITDNTVYNDPFRDYDHSYPNPENQNKYLGKPEKTVKSPEKRPFLQNNTKTGEKYSKVHHCKAAKNDENSIRNPRNLSG